MVRFTPNRCWRLMARLLVSLLVLQSMSNFLTLSSFAQTVKTSPKPSPTRAKTSVKRGKKPSAASLQLGADNLAQAAYRIWLTYYQAQQQGKQPSWPTFNVPKSVAATEAQWASSIWQQAQLKAQQKISPTATTDNNKQKTNIKALADSPISFTYNVMGLRQTMTDGSGTTIYSYDNRDRLISKQTPQGTLTYTYNGGGNVLSVRSSNANGVSIDYTYDSLNRLQTLKDNRLASTAPPLTYTYDNVGNLISVALPNGVVTTYTYNSLNRLTNVSVTKANAVIASYDYTLGPAGNRLTVTELGGRSVSYTYDDLYRLKRETINGGTTAQNHASVSHAAVPLKATPPLPTISPLMATANRSNTIANIATLQIANSLQQAGVSGVVTYDYDAVGNRLSQTSTLPGITSATYNYDANDRLTGEVYDDNGNVISTNGRSFTYDHEDHIKTINGNGLNISINYDGDGSRIAKTVNGVTTNYLVDELNPTGYAQVYAEIQNGQVIKRYTYGHQLISQAVLINGQWQVFYYGYDGQGNVRFLTDANGTITDRYDYDANGNLIASTGNTPNNYLYRGQQYDSELGVYYLRARYLNPANGRFSTMDQFAGINDDPPSLHKYLYANADPVNKSDPSGNFTLVDVSIANSIRSILTNIEGTFGQSLIDQVRFGENAGLKSLATSGLFILGSAVAGKAIAALKSSRGLKLGGKVSDLTAFEQQVAQHIGAEEYGILGIGDKGVRETLGLSKTSKAADFLSQTSSGKFNITEVKESLNLNAQGVETALEQIAATIGGVQAKVPGAKFGVVEIAIPKGAGLGGIYQISGNQLVKVVNGNIEVVRVLGEVVMIRQIP